MAALRELGGAVAVVIEAAEVAVEEVVQRAGQVEDDIADRVLAFVRAPPDLLVVERFDALADLGGEDGGDAGAEGVEDLGNNLVGHDCVEYRLFICIAPEIPSRTLS